MLVRVEIRRLFPAQPLGYGTGFKPSNSDIID